MTRQSFNGLEQLEPRTLLSTSLPPATLSLNIAQPMSSVAPISVVPFFKGVTLHLTAGVAFTGMVAFYPSPVLDPPLAYSANIAWGDGAVSPAKLQYGFQGTVGGYQIIGSHTYKYPGTFKITTTVIQGPINPGPLASATFPSKIVATIISQAIVSPGVISHGVILNEIAGQSFFASVGAFTLPAPLTGMQAVITWGDGSTSTGTVASMSANPSATGPQTYSVIGDHTYGSAGLYPIHVVVYKSPPPGTSIAVQLIVTIDSSAVVKPDVTVTPAAPVVPTVNPIISF